MNSLDIYYYNKNIRDHIERDFDEQDDENFENEIDNDIPRIDGEIDEKQLE